MFTTMNLIYAILYYCGLIILWELTMKNKNTKVNVAIGFKRFRTLFMCLRKNKNKKISIYIYNINLNFKIEIIII